MNNELKNNILQRIEQEQIEPKPRWQFVAREVAMWIVGIVASLIGAVAVAVVIYLFRSSDLDMLFEDKGGASFELFRIIPYFWLVLLGLFVVLARYQIRHTKRGYRYPVWSVVGMLVSSSLVVGVGFSATGVGQFIDQGFEEHMPLYGDVLVKKHQVWCPLQGDRLGGLVLEVVDEDQFRVVDFYGHEWMVDLSRIEETTADVEPDVVVRLLGELVEGDLFEAEMLRVKRNIPFGPPERFMENEDLHGKRLSPPGAINYSPHTYYWVEEPLLTRNIDTQCTNAPWQSPLRLSA